MRIWQNLETSLSLLTDWWNSIGDELLIKIGTMSIFFLWKISPWYEQKKTELSIFVRARTVYVHKNALLHTFHIKLEYNQITITLPFYFTTQRKICWHALWFFIRIGAAAINVLPSVSSHIHACTLLFHTYLFYLEKIKNLFSCCKNI